MGELDLLPLTASAAAICSFQAAWSAAAMLVDVKVIAAADADATRGPGVDMAPDAGSP
jgi:hypothetical protein